MADQRRYRPLTAADVAGIPPCPHCGAPGASADAAWVRGAVHAFGCAGVGAWDDGELVGHLLVATTTHLPPGIPPQAADRDTAFLVGLRVPDGHPGLGRGLLQAVAGRLPVRHLDAQSGPGGCCHHLPEAWLAESGFKPLRRVGAVTTWRLDTTSAVRWLRLPATAWERLVDLMPRPQVAPPEPAGRRAS